MKILSNYILTSTTSNCNNMINNPRHQLTLLIIYTWLTSVSSVNLVTPSVGLNASWTTDCILSTYLYIQCRTNSNCQIQHHTVNIYQLSKDWDHYRWYYSLAKGNTVNRSKPVMFVFTDKTSSSIQGQMIHEEHRPVLLIKMKTKIEPEVHYSMPRPHSTHNS